MCGHAGMARHPKAKSTGLAEMIFRDLLRRNKSRGHHATGVGALACDITTAPAILKAAVPADTFLDSDRFGAFMAEHRKRPLWIGHTRWGTQHHNKASDEAAHPFHIGSVVGAHNGIIVNHAALAPKYAGERKRFDVDSEAAIAVLSARKNPVKALDLLDGYWSLVWSRDGVLYTARTDDAPLAMAYIPSWRTLFWSSLAVDLRHAFKAADLGDALEMEMWETKPGQVYRFDLEAFTDRSTGRTMVAAGFAGRTTTRASRLADSARPTLPGTTNAPIKRRRAAATFGGNWNPVTGREEFGAEDGPDFYQTEASLFPDLDQSSTPMTMAAMTKAVIAMQGEVSRLRAQVAKLEGEMEGAQAEIDHLLTMGAEAGMFDRTRQENLWPVTT